MWKHLWLCPVLFAACTDATSSGGIELDDLSPTHASGHTSALAFDLSSDGNIKSAVISDRHGSELLATTIDATGARTTSYFGGRLRIDSAPGQQPTYTGDRAAPAQLAASADEASLEALGDELLAAGVDASLLPTWTPPHEESIGYIVANPCGSWNAVGDQSVCGTYLFGTTKLQMENCGSYYQEVVFDGLQELVPPGGVYTLFGRTYHYCGTLDRTDSYFGAFIPFVNTGPGTASIYYGH